MFRLKAEASSKSESIIIEVLITHRLVFRLHQLISLFLTCVNVDEKRVRCTHMNCVAYVLGSSMTQKMKEREKKMQNQFDFILRTLKHTNAKTATEITSLKETNDRYKNGLRNET